MSKTIYFLIRGGLGNQLFQYAAGLYAEQRWGIPVRFHVREDDGEHPRLFMLDQFMVTRPMYPVRYLDRHLYYGSRQKGIKKTIRRACGVRVIDESSQYEIEPQLLAPPTERKVLLRGCWQSKDYLNRQVGKLRSEFRLRHEPTGSNAAQLANIKNTDCPVSLHIRRGDYRHFTANGGILLPLEYYHAAIRSVHARFRNAHFFVFSDDLEWARKHLPAGLPASFVAGNGEALAYEDLRLMSACKHHIIANSTFSWWGAWLNPDPGKTVIMPKLWMGAMPTPDGLIENGWETLPSKY